MLKQLHKFYNNEDTPWVHLIRDAYYYNSVPRVVVSSGSFWWKGIFALATAYRVITKAVVGSGTSIMFWSDLWGNEKLEQRYPRLFSFVLDKEQSVAQFMASGDRTDNFYLPLSVEA